MKKILALTLLLAASFHAKAQISSYTDLGTKFTSEDLNGTSRFVSMGGAFGALGGDLSAISVNPAGAAVFMDSQFTGTLGYRSTEFKSNYYGTPTNSNDDYFNIQQIGVVFVNEYNSSTWSKVAFGFNYTLSTDYDNDWRAEGNSNFPTFTKSPDGESEPYLYTTGQRFLNVYEGQKNRYEFFIAADVNDQFQIGGSIISFSNDLNQNVILKEYNDDNQGNELDATLDEYLEVRSNGIALNFGLIYKPIQSVRLGLSYQTPTWYSVSEAYVKSERRFFSIDETTYVDNFDPNFFDYDLRTPSKTTASFAYIFGKKGLISVDYTYQNYSNIEYDNPYNDFNNENRFFSQNLNGVSQLRIGTEWRLKNLSLRGGYNYEQSPYKNSKSSENINRIAFGLGYNFGRVKIDLSYQNVQYDTYYDFYPQYEQVDLTKLKVNTSSILGSVSIEL
ncbi:OmpP1/FadL family transporter [Aureivirga sp. CE67]|uniref:OmpP1/FadL family transporter n=1 Tax=Aureivirga sp. CE67 TaxID=1788983 RepID=UPI0018C9F7D8|nr:outer membrane protein transport protein [Aureivirga sp. CE67]